MTRVVIVGGGLAGCAAAATAAKAGASVTLLERTDVLGGCGILAGMVKKYRSLCAKEELRAMGGYDIFQVFDNCLLHESVKWPWPKPDGVTNIYYDVTQLDPELRKHLSGMGVEIRLISRAKDVEMDGKVIRAVILDDKSKVPGDVFIDTTGGAGGIANCQRYGNGCAMCFMRCPAFGDRVSIAKKAGVKELMGKKRDGSFGPITSAFCLLKESIAPELKKEMERVGYISIPLPPELINYKRTESITASGNIDKGFAENVVLSDIGGSYAKRTAAGYTPLDELRKVPGLERAIYADPIGGTIGNAVRYMALTPRGDALNVPGVENLFVASEKLGVASLSAAVVLGAVAGHNAVRKAVGMAPLVLPRTIMLGDFIAYLKENWDTEEGLKTRFHMWTGAFFRRAKESGLYTEDKAMIRSRIEKEGLVNVFSQNIVS